MGDIRAVHAVQPMFIDPMRSIVVKSKPLNRPSLNWRWRIDGDALELLGKHYKLYVDRHEQDFRRRRPCRAFRVIRYSREPKRYDL